MWDRALFRNFHVLLQADATCARACVNPVGGHTQQFVGVVIVGGGGVGIGVGVITLPLRFPAVIYCCVWCFIRLVPAPA